MEGLEDLIPGYLAARRDEVPEMRALIAAGDFERLAWLAHDVKGSGGSYGFLDLTRLGGALEMSAQEGDANELRELVAQLDDYLGRIQLVL